MHFHNLNNKQFYFNIGLVVIALSFLGILGCMTYSTLQNHAEKSAVESARRSADQLLVTWSIMSQLGPHVSLDEHIDPFAMAPVAVSTEIGKELHEKYGYYIKPTSSKYRNKMNIPDPSEAKMLARLEAGEDETWRREDFNGVDSLRYSKVLKVEQACLKCHGQPYTDVPAPLYKKLIERYGDRAFNYKIGEIRGMISVTVPMKQFHKDANALFLKISAISLIAFVLLLLGIVLHQKFIIQPHVKLLAESKKQLYYSTFRDPMTGIQNRRAFNQNIRENIDTYQRDFWLLFINLDDFKALNDRYGQETGDDVLVSIGNRLNTIGDNSDIFRTGGDEFIIMVYHRNSREQISLLLHQLVSELNRPITVGTHDITMTASIGAVHYPTDAMDIETLIRRGDLAVYNAKESGKNRFVIYDQELLAASDAFRTMQNDLKQALDNDEFFLVYQPQYDVAKQCIVGAEALLRWNHPEHGIIGPGEFISIAEESGMMKDIGRWILLEACRQNQHWQDAGYAPINIAVNVTAAQLEDLGFVVDLIDVIGETGLNPDNLEIEFIERSAINNEGNTIEFMNQLKLMRIHAAIDDFGTGYSSLSYISKFPIDKIKIDYMFINDIHEKEDNATIVRSIIAIAKNLKIKVLAEGVEKEEELRFLVNEGCTLFQGYYFSKPLLPDELEKRLT